MLIKNIYIIGSGAYGCGLANVFSKKFGVTIVGRNLETVRYINDFHRHSKVLSGVEFSDNIVCQVGYDNLCRADIIFICTPVAGVRDVCKTISRMNLLKDVPIVLCSKGIEVGTNKFTSSIAEEYLENPIFILSGPSFAEEIARGLPCCVSLSSMERVLCDNLAKDLSLLGFVIDPNYDVIGTQVCAAFKNVLAILCGVFKGLGLGESSKSYLITRALGEVRLIIRKLGGDSGTLDRVCGIGDIILTCMNEMSRNVRFGIFLAEGGRLEDWKGELAEGAYTARMMDYFNRRDIPVFYMAYDIIYSKKVAMDVIRETLFSGV